MNIVHNCDCMEYMKDIPDNYFELAIVDPPYGIGENWNKNKHQQFYGHKNSFNNSIPKKEYFLELCRISQNQIIWGGNYYCHNLGQRNSWIYWNKCRDVCKTFMSEGELAWSSFNKPMRSIEIIWDGAKKGNETGSIMIHPHQKPVSLYRWLLQNYAKQTDKIFDSHVGSGSSRIACYELGFDFTGCELDKYYWEAQEKRFALEKAKIDNRFYLPDEENLLF
jgi:site-specific DNA-methyltransferase (adenine-specific)